MLEGWETDRIALAATISLEDCSLLTSKPSNP